jgi:hypothetical protein
MTGFTGRNVASEQLLWERCRRDPQYFVFDSGLVTKDEHDLNAPAKPFPDEPYLRILLDVLCVSGRILAPEQARYAVWPHVGADWLQAVAQSGMVLVEKSRQVMATWLCCAYLLWRGKFHAHQLLLVQSKREDDAANLVFCKEAWQARMSFMETHLPKALQSVVFPRGGSYCQLNFPSGSRAWGIPEGGDIVRSNTPSVIFADEAAFQPEFGASFTAALPAIKGGGSYIGVSSAEPGTFADMVEA